VKLRVLLYLAKTSDPWFRRIGVLLPFQLRETGFGTFFNFERTYVSEQSLGCICFEHS
jgi:hypothetical protein